MLIIHTFYEYTDQNTSQKGFMQISIWLWSRKIMAWLSYEYKLRLFVCENTHTHTHPSKSSKQIINQHILWNYFAVYFIWFFFNVCVCLQIVVCKFILYFCFVFLILYPMLPISLNCPFLIAPSIFSYVYLNSLL